MSRSMSDREYQMVKDGYKAAFADPRSSGPSSPIPRALLSPMSNSGRDEFTVVKGWDVLTDAMSARSFGDTGIATRTSSETPHLPQASRKRRRC